MPTADAPDDWTLDSHPTPAGVRIAFAAPAQGILSAAIELTREEARAFAHAVLADAGDATHRTFPRPSAEEG